MGCWVTWGVLVMGLSKGVRGFLYHFNDHHVHGERVSHRCSFSVNSCHSIRNTLLHITDPLIVSLLIQPITDCSLINTKSYIFVLLHTVFEEHVG